MTGMISYADAPAFHNLVDNKDYRMICIFEVFSQNRQEDDFLENLALIAQIIKEQEHQNSVEEVIGNHQMQSAGTQLNQRDEYLNNEDQPANVSEDIFLTEVESLGAEGLVGEDMEQWLREKYEEKDKMLNSVFNTFKQTNDRPDFVNSLNRLYQKYLRNKQASQVHTVAAPV